MRLQLAKMFVLGGGDAFAPRLELIEVKYRNRERERVCEREREREFQFQEKSIKIERR